MRTPEGSVKRRGNLYLARITWLENGKRREKKALVKTKNEGVDKTNGWRNQWLATGTVVDNPRQAEPSGGRTVAELVNHYRDHYAVPAVIRDGKKISGLKSWKVVREHAERARTELGAIPLESLSWEHLHVMRNKLVGGRTRKGTDRTVAYVNRVMSTVRRILKVARQLRWMRHNPFAEGDILIERAHEVERTRIITPAEEAAILAACGQAANDRMKIARKRLKTMIVIALETGMRAGEIVSLEWRQIDWKAGVIRVIGTHTKTEAERFVPITTRLRVELKAWQAGCSPNQVRVLDLKNRPTEAWKTTRAEAAAKVPSLAADPIKFHDFRHTAATRMIAAGVPEPIVGRILGHKTAQTTRRYINLDLAAALSAAEKVDRAHAGVIEKAGRRRGKATPAAVN